MAADITRPYHADDLAAILVPQQKGERDPYFTNTAQRLLTGVIEAFPTLGARQVDIS